ncbi:MULTISPECIES: glycosyltransferase [unclassified Herbaspirillum]|uniref:glycosyltransferase n=1 Tax=unclassified Herbaspirillum TaxID=2624150 RepID=UPI0011ADF8D0|nr:MULTISPECIES: glycosyltransferase [unclassified Herbaspirillum]MBB5390092.1 glycosyltransferase involved in cell wall biosynthesis [Herbaspirillum sp. SJZ102]TWC69628.1 glycosyltransferase involved in cell wall biosynthesis [Herbaspirillum sp. SJZ099]
MHQEAGRSPIAIYPEVVSDNPLNARNVVRYLLAEPAIYTGRPINLQPRDLVYTFGPTLVPKGWVADMLRIPLVDTRLFNSIGVDDTKRKGTAVFIHRHLNKGGELHPIAADSIEISYRVPERSAAQLAEIFRSVECLYMYEHSTVCFEALLCGCPVVYIMNATSLPESFPWLMKGKGISWGLNPEDIAQAKQTVHEASDVYQEEEDAFWNDLRSLVEKTQKSAVGLNGEPIHKTHSPVAVNSTITATTLPPVGGVFAKRKKRLLVFSVESTWSPCPQIRLIRPFAKMSDEWEIEWGIKNSQLDTAAAARADVILLHRFTPGLLPISALDVIFKLGKPVIYESDDLLNEIPTDHPEAAAGASWKEGIEYSVKRAQAVVVSTHFLAEKYRQLNANVHVLQNYLDYDIFHRDVPRKQKGEAITIGLLGSSIQPSNFALVHQALRTICERYRDKVRIDFVGWHCPQGWEQHPNARFTSFIHEYEKYAVQLKHMEWDIALIPLAQDEYNQCKSFVKWLDYSAAGIASIFSDVSVYNAVVTNESTGLLMPNSSQAWLDAIVSLIESPELRSKLAIQAQQEVKNRFGLKQHVHLYNEVYSSFIHGAPKPTVQRSASEINMSTPQAIPRRIAGINAGVTASARNILKKTN